MSNGMVQLAMTDFEGIELARGYFDKINLAENQLLVSGWLLLLDREFTTFSLYVDGELIGSSPPSIREDVGAAFPWLSHANRAGFHFCVGSRKPAGKIDVVGYCGKRPTGLLSTLFRSDTGANLPIVPSSLMKRVTGLESPDFFRANGMKSFSDFMFAVRRYRELNTIRRMLDWGCGCGRVTAQFLLDGAISAVHGCDIDPEAIMWCSENLKPATFLHIDPWPPTPYNDATFDLVIGYSVFTHLERQAQKAWLEEIKRITAPGGLFLASTHGEFAAQFVSRPKRG